MGGGRSMDSLISPKGNQKKDMQYEQTHKIFLCSFGEYLMHIRSGLCNVNFRMMGKKAIILKTNVAVSEKKLWFTERGCSNTPGLKWYPATSRWQGCREEECSFQDAFCIQLKLQEPELSYSPSVRTSCSVRVRYSPYSRRVGLEPQGSSARTGAPVLSRGWHLGGESWQTQCKCRCCRCLWLKRPDTAPTPPISTTDGASGSHPPCKPPHFIDQDFVFEKSVKLVPHSFRQAPRQAVIQSGLEHCQGLPVCCLLRSPILSLVPSLLHFASIPTSFYPYFPFCLMSFLFVPLLLSGVVKSGNIFTLNKIKYGCPLEVPDIPVFRHVIPFFIPSTL